MDLPKHYQWKPDYPGPSSAAAPTIRKDLPAFQGLQAYFLALEVALDLVERRTSGKWLPRVGVYLYGPLAAHLYTGESQTGLIHCRLAYPIEIPNSFEISLATSHGPLLMRMAKHPAARDLRWPGQFARPEVELDLGVDSFDVRAHDPVDLVVSMCTEFSPEDEACIRSLINAELITASLFDLAWADSLGDGDPTPRDLDIRSRVMGMF